MKKGARYPGYLLFVLGDEISYPVIFRDYFINHYNKDPVIKQPGFQWKVGPFFPTSGSTKTRTTWFFSVVRETNEPEIA